MLNLVTLIEPQSAAAEAYQSLRTNLEFAGLEQPLRTILVTSVDQQTEKSIALANLAVVMAQAGDRVLVVDGGASLRRALLGGNLGAAAARNGWAGVLIDGCVRDVAELAACDTGIRALAAMPLPTDRRQQGLRDVVVKIQGVLVRPGEWLYADEDGTVVAGRPLHPAG